MGSNCCGNDENKKQGGCCGGHEDQGCGCGGHEHNHDHEDCGCGCGCGEHESMFVELEDEDGNVMNCEIVDGFLFKENEYALVQNPDDGSIYLFKVVGDDEVGELVVPEDEEYDAAKAYYEELIARENEEN